MYYYADDNITRLTDTDKEKLVKITKHLIHQVSMPQPGLYASKSNQELWLSLMLTFCVISGKRLDSDLRIDQPKLKLFSENLDFRKLLSMKNNRKEYIAKILKNFKATSFYNKQAERLEDVLASPKVFFQGQFIMLKDIHADKQDYREIRELLTARVPHFKMKSASDFMIENGLSIDIVGFNTRIIEVLRDHFDFNIDNQKIQGSKKIYESVESALRETCNNLGVPLAYMSRMLNYYSGKDTISYILEDL